MNKHQEKELRYAKWEALIKEQEKSGLSQSIFCQEKQIQSSDFSYYRSRLQKEKDKKINLFSPIHLQKPSAIGDLQIILPNGLKCILPCTTDGVYVKQIISILLSC